jgi:endonuclease/exonuclease/phosphatase family metal-dependent hydrolase
MKRLVVVLCILALSTARLRGDEKDPPPIRVMSFNIRYGTAADGENHWDRRKELLADTITAFDPDLLGTQETLAFQRDYLAERLKGYTPFAAGRDDGKERGEMAAVFFRAARFEKLDGGHFWLSEKPDVAGSKSWDAALTRIATWLKLRDRRPGDGKGERVLWYFNTHFDHLGKRARGESARLLHDRIARLKDHPPVIVTGDFNDAEGSEAYTSLFAADDTGKPLLIDTFRAAHPKQGSDEATFNFFRPGFRLGPRLDWIGCTRHWRVESAAIDHTARDGRLPSDHYPVTAVLRYAE